MKIHGLYVITDPLPPGDALLNAVAGVLAGGAKTVQYRNKSADPRLRHEQALQVRRLCWQHGRTFIVNDDPDLAVAVDADGVHIGREDPELGTTRRLVGKHRLIGVSCYNDLDLALAAQAQGADYVAFGSFYPSRAKPQATRADVELLLRARPVLQIPIVAIGGITPENGAPLLRAGADALAVIHAVFGCSDHRRAAGRLARLFTNEGVQRDESKPD